METCNHDLDSPNKTLKATMAPRFGWRCTVCLGEWYPDTEKEQAPEESIVPVFALEMINGHAVANAFVAIAHGIRALSQDSGLPEETIREMFYKAYPHWTGIAPNL